MTRHLVFTLLILAACNPPPKDPTCPNSLCSDHGQCAAPGAFPECACDPGYEGATCAVCAAGFHVSGGGCAKDEVCGANACGAHGACNSDDGVAYCVCEEAYAGDDCDACAFGFHAATGACVLDEQCMPRSCSAAGTCTVDAGVVACACDAGYTGATCESCDAGYHRGVGDACVVNDSCALVDPCTHPGECDDSTGVAVCRCNTGYTGSSCDACYPGYHGSGVCVPDTECIASSCSGNGTCHGTGGVVACTCASGYTGAACTECDSAFHLETNPVTSFVCAPNEICGSPAPCLTTPTGAIVAGGTGTSCDDSSGVIACNCAEGYAGALCDGCAVGYRDTLAAAPIPFCVPKEHCLASSCGLRADGTTPRGTCDDSSGVVVCDCDLAYDYSGTYCELSLDNCANNACNNGSPPNPGFCVDLDVNLSAPSGVKNDGDYVCVCPDGHVPSSNGHQCQ